MKPSVIAVIISASVGAGMLLTFVLMGTANAVTYAGIVVDATMVAAATLVALRNPEQRS